MPQPRFQLADFLTAAAETAPNDPCFRLPDGSQQSFVETEARVARLATALMREGVRQGDRVAILAVDGPQYLETIMACTMLGVVFAPLNNRLRQSEVAILLAKAEPKALFISGRYAAVVADIVPTIAGLRMTVCYDATPGLVAYEALLADGDPTRPDVNVQDEDCAAVVFTSGTTGLPKAAMQSEKSLKGVFMSAMTNCELRYSGCGYSGSPLFHVAGYVISYSNLISRSATFMLPQFDPAALLKAIDQGGLSHCLLVPTMVTMVLDHPDCATTSFEGLERIVYGAAPMPPALLRRAIDRFGCDFVQVFGAATETGTQTVLSSADHRRALAGEEHLLGSVGRAAFAVRMKIVDPEGNQVPTGIVGEIVTRSDQTMMGYLDMPVATDHAIRGEWFWGGDLGRVDEQGFVYLSGRSKDMIIRGGENIYPVEIETVMSVLPGVTHVSVIGEPDDRWGETVLACLMVDENFCGIDAALEHCSRELARYKVPARIEILATMPMTASGKISKPHLRDAGRDGRRDSYGAQTESATA